MPMMFLTAAVLATSSLVQVHSPGDQIGRSPVLPAPYATPSNTNNPRPTPFAENRGPTAIAGFSVKPFARGLQSPRNAIVLPNGDVLVAEAKTEAKYEDPKYRDAGANRITLLRDANRDGIAET